MLLTQGTQTRRRWSFGFAGALISVGILVTAAAGAAAHDASPRRPAAAHHARTAVPTDTPTQVIDANTDPAAAAAALNAGCSDLSHCTWATTSVGAGWGPVSILGDALYNCAPTGSGANALTAVGVSEQRGETTNVSDRVSVTLQGGLIGLASLSASFTAFTKQSQSVTSKVTSTNAVNVPPGWKGYTTSQALSAFVTGDTYVTDGIHLVEVKDVQLTIPGWQPSSDRSPKPTIANAYSAPMTSAELATQCGAVIGNPTAGHRKPPTGQFDVVICQHRSGCRTHTVTGPPPPVPAHKAEVRLSDGDTLYAKGYDTKEGRIRLTPQQAIPAGTYTLTIREPLPSHGSTTEYRTSAVPITIA